jgi:uncharacterized protein YuzE
MLGPKQGEYAMLRGSGSWSYDAAASAWYFKLDQRAEPPVRDCVFVEARIDLDDEGRVVGVEMLDPRLLPPKQGLETK